MVYNSSCTKVQARVDRYYAGYVRQYLGPQAYYSEVFASNGTAAGNYGRGWDGWGSWPGWTRVY